MDMSHCAAPLALMSVFILLDIVTGLIGAAAQGDFSSSKMREGLFHKSAFYGAFALAVALEACGNYVELGVDVPAVGVVATYVILTEVTSILENLCIINPDLKNNKFLAMFGKEA